MSDPTFSRQFGITLLLLEVVLIILHALCTTYTEVPTVSSNAVAVEKDIVLNHYGFAPCFGWAHTEVLWTGNSKTYM